MASNDPVISAASQDEGYACLCASGQRHTVPFKSGVMVRELAAFLDSGQTNQTYKKPPTCGPHAVVKVRKVDGKWVDTDE